MAYSINPNLPKARALAMQLLNQEGLPLKVVANRCGVNRSTIWRWQKKWQEINQNVQLENFGRPTRIAGTKFRWAALKWLIPTLSSKPLATPKAISKEIVELVLSLRQMLKRCAEVVWYHLIHDNGVTISLSSVRRILRRHHCFDGARKKLARPDNHSRPHVTKPGELVETDTIYYICPLTKAIRYVYTVIDLYTRMAYAEIHPSILPGLAARVVLHARNEFGFNFSLVQSDNGSEFSGYFEQVLRSNGMRLRHTRLGRPNDNAHIERFNRTIQEECLGNTITYNVATKHLQRKIYNYLEFYNFKRIHLGLQMRIPAEMLQRS